MPIFFVFLGQKTAVKKTTLHSGTVKIQKPSPVLQARGDLSKTGVCSLHAVNLFLFFVQKFFSFIVLLNFKCLFAVSHCRWEKI